jgi:hypothetical protein
MDGKGVGREREREQERVRRGPLLVTVLVGSLTKCCPVQVLGDGASTQSRMEREASRGRIVRLRARTVVEGEAPRRNCRHYTGRGRDLQGGRVDFASTLAARYPVTGVDRVLWERDGRKRRRRGGNGLDSRNGTHALAVNWVGLCRRGTERRGMERDSEPSVSRVGQ